MHFLLIYELSADYLERRTAFRDRHLTVAWASAARGELLLGGALEAPVDRAMLLFEADSPAVPEAFARADPYVTEGLVTRWEVRKWNTVAGEGAAQPVRPA
ncbi:YciI-like protein [Caballeronia udeis]|uniref:YciI-like protein n=1 Tax=Caballeronia udeis TaxID=1232866 RepID=A0A158JP48_9BURK|nr:YciI-like protein [Caballeronia udeis]SAL70626.1 YciI-like protein [Caballeronia udeis]